MYSQLTLTSLHWDDILFVQILPLLNIEDLFILRGLSRECKRLIDSYFGVMKELKLSKSEFSIPRFKVLSNNCHNLTVLSLRYCEDVEVHELKHLLDCNRMIRHLDLTGCQKLTCVCLQPVVAHFKNLHGLILNTNKWINSGCLEALAQHLSKLKILELHDCSSLGDVCAINNLLQKCTGLQKLNLSGIDCVRDSTMETLSHFNLELESLNIRHCRLVTDYGVRMVVEYCKKLKTLLLAGCAASRLLSLQSTRDISPMLELDFDIDMDSIAAFRLAV